MCRETPNCFCFWSSCSGLVAASSIPWGAQLVVHNTISKTKILHEDRRNFFFSFLWAEATVGNADTEGGALGIGAKQQVVCDGCFVALLVLLEPFVRRLGRLESTGLESYRPAAPKVDVPIIWAIGCSSSSGSLLARLVRYKGLSKSGSGGQRATSCKSDGVVAENRDE